MRTSIPSPSTQQISWPLPWVTAGLLGLAVAAILAYLQPLLLAALLLAGLILLLAWARPFWLFGLLLAGLPLHDHLLRVLTWQWHWPAGRITLISLWKEGLIALLLAVMVIQHLSGRRPIQARLYQFDLWLVALGLLSAAYVLLAPVVSLGVFGFRNYWEPVALLLLARFMPYSRSELKRLLLLLTVMAAGVAAFGIYQAQFIDFATMVRMGYVDEAGRLPFAFKTALRDFQPRPRAISTVTGPNQLAVYLQLFVLLAAFGLLRWRQFQRRLLLAGLIVLLAVCWLLTFSRGGLLAMGTSWLAWAMIYVYDRGVRRTWRELTQNRLLLAGLIALLLLASSGLIVTGFARRVVRGLTGQDPAALGHIDSLISATNLIIRNPLGNGIGMVGPRAKKMVNDLNLDVEVGHAESTYLQFGMEAGVPGLILLAAVSLSLVATLWRLRQKRRRLGDTAAQALIEWGLVVWIGALAVFVVTPLLQNMLVAGYLWLIAGLAFHVEAYSQTVSHER